MSSAPLEEVSADHHCDVLIVGGGINGVGIARDLVGRGWSVLLCEQDDLASHTSSASTKLIHGGLRYLEQGHVGLVRKALMEREVLLRSAPHLMAPLRFVLPYDANMRPAWMIRVGLWLYDHLAVRDFLPGSHGVALRGHVLGQPLQPQWTRGFVYSDGWVDDARLVVLCAQDAADRGALFLTRTRCEALRPFAGGWRARLKRHDALSLQTTQEMHVQARLVVNAAGPWADQVLRQLQANPAKGAATPAARHLRLVKGSHIVVPRRFEHDHAYIFQGKDGRIIFAIPYEREYTLIGTTDVDVSGPPGDVAITREEINYLCDQVNRYLSRPVYPSDVVWSFAGVRPLLDDAKGRASEVTRDYRLETQALPAPWLTVWGGKLTTYRKLAEQAASLVSEQLGDPRLPWTIDARLPGGDLGELVEETRNPPEDLAAFALALRKCHPWLDLPLLRRWTRAYGSLTLKLLHGVRGRSDLGQEVAPDLYEAELFYLRRHEWASTADDVLWRRSKLGLHFTADQREAVAAWFRAQSAGSEQPGFHHSNMSRHD